MSRWSPAPGFAKRCAEARTAATIDPKNERASFARQVGIPADRYRWHEDEDRDSCNEGSFEDLMRGLYRYWPAEEHPKLYVYMRDGTGELPEPLPLTERARVAANEPRTASDLDHRTPFSGTAVPMIVDPEVAIDRAMEDVRAGRDPMPRLEAAKALLQAWRVARNAGLAGVFVAGTWGGMSANTQENAKIRREEITTWLEVETYREERRRRPRPNRKTGT
jgi:hypothetical protein